MVNSSDPAFRVTPMRQVLIRNLDDHVIESLKTKAALQGHSLGQELREVLTAAAPLSAKEKVALFRRIRAKSPSLKRSDIGAAIRAGRDDEHL
jgi:plasmid stability protein